MVETKEVGEGEREGSLTPSVVTYSVILSLMNENLKCFLGLMNVPERTLSPTRELDNKLLAYLLCQGRIEICSDIFNRICHDKPELFLYAGIIDIALPDDAHDITEYVGKIKKELSVCQTDLEYKQIIELLVELSVHECLDFINSSFDKYLTPIILGSRTEIIIKDALVEYNVGQLISLLWSSIKSAIATVQSAKCSRKQAADLVIPRFERLLVRAKSESWALTRYRRLWNLQQSRLSRVLFEDVLKVDDDGYGFSISWYRQNFCEKS